MYIGPRRTKIVGCWHFVSKVSSYGVVEPGGKESGEGHVQHGGDDGGQLILGKALHFIFPNERGGVHLG